jgi:hypothetical protein
MAFLAIRKKIDETWPVNDFGEQDEKASDFDSWVIAQMIVTDPDLIAQKKAKALTAEGLG